MQEGIKNSIINLMKTMKWSVQEAMTALDVSETEQVKYAEMIKKMMN